MVRNLCMKNWEFEYAAFKSCKSCSFSTTLLPLKLVHVNCQPFCGFCQPTIFAKRFGDTLINQFSENQHFHLSWKLSWFQTFFFKFKYVIQSSPHLSHPTHFWHSKAHSPNSSIQKLTSPNFLEKVYIIRIRTTEGSACLTFRSFGILLSQYFSMLIDLKVLRPNGAHQDHWRGACGWVSLTWTRLPLLPNYEGVYLSDNHSFIPTSPRKRRL